MLTKQDIRDMGYPNEPWFGDAVAAANDQHMNPTSSTFAEDFAALWAFFRDGGSFVPDEVTMEIGLDYYDVTD